MYYILYIRPQKSVEEHQCSTNEDSSTLFAVCGAKASHDRPQKASRNINPVPMNTPRRFLQSVVRRHRTMASVLKTKKVEEASTSRR